MLQLHLSDQQLNGLLRCLLYQKFDGRSLCPYQLAPGDTRDHVELCPEGGVLAQELSNRVAIDGGFALIADYGHLGTKTDTFRVGTLI